MSEKVTDENLKGLREIGAYGTAVKAPLLYQLLDEIEESRKTIPALTQQRDELLEALEQCKGEMRNIRWQQGENWARHFKQETRNMYEAALVNAEKLITKVKGAL